MYNVCLCTLIWQTRQYKYGVKIQYALQILDFTLNMPHAFWGPVAPPPNKIKSTPPPPGVMYCSHRRARDWTWWNWYRGWWFKSINDKGNAHSFRNTWFHSLWGVHDFTQSLYYTLQNVSWDFVYRLMARVCMPRLVWLLCLGLIVFHSMTVYQKIPFSNDGKQDIAKCCSMLNTTNRDHTWHYLHERGTML